MAKIILKPGKEKSVISRHPWIFSGAIKDVSGIKSAGDIVEVRSNDLIFLGWAFFSPNSSIRGRILSWNEDEIIGEDFFRGKLSKALELRKALVKPGETDAYRLFHAESDGIPGLILDRYADYVVMQSLISGIERWKACLAEMIAELTGVRNVYERSDADVRQLEGLSRAEGVLEGAEPPDTVLIHENGLKFLVDIRCGQKTGFYIDQRHNRQVVREQVQKRVVLNCFCYTGAFTVYALAGGADHVLSIDSSSQSLALASLNVKENDYSHEKVEWIEGNVFVELRKLRDRGAQFDAIILDPPKFAPTAAQAQKAARGYKDINLLAFKLLKPGGLLFTFSCSGGISAELFRKIVSGAARDADVEAVIVNSLSQGADHPVSLNFPEGAYLKGLVCRKYN